MKEGNGEPDLCLFPETVTPNHHKLAREFVLLDNFYVDGEVSADGHEWTMGAYATDFVEKIWPLSYRGGEGLSATRARGTRTDRTARGGYLWDQCAEAKVSYRSYGEWIEQRRAGQAGWHVPGLQADGQGPGRTLRPAVPRLRPGLPRREAGRALPRGTASASRKPARCRACRSCACPTTTPPARASASRRVTAMVADNDLALGRVVEAVSQSKFWKETAIFVIEDDAQNGPDHVDAHRTVALVISPYTKRQATSTRTLYSTSQHAADDGADPRPAADEPVRRRGPADVQLLHQRSPT